MKEQKIITKLENGEKITFKSDKIEWEKEYDEKGNLVHYKKFTNIDENGRNEYWYKYDEMNRVIEYKDNINLLINYYYYDDIIIKKEHTIFGSLYISVFDLDNNIIYDEKDGIEIWFDDYKNDKEKILRLIKDIKR